MHPPEGAEVSADAGPRVEAIPGMARAVKPVSRVY